MSVHESTRVRKREGGVEGSWGGGMQAPYIFPSLFLLLLLLLLLSFWYLYLLRFASFDLLLLLCFFFPFFLCPKNSIGVTATPPSQLMVTLPQGVAARFFFSFLSYKYLQTSKKNFEKKQRSTLRNSPTHPPPHPSPLHASSHCASTSPASSIPFFLLLCGGAEGSGDGKERRKEKSEAKGDGGRLFVIEKCLFFFVRKNMANQRVNQNIRKGGEKKMEERKIMKERK